MKIYKVKVNGKVYEVELEAVSETAAKIESVKTESVVAPTPTPAPVSTAANMVKAPLQGTILSVSVAVGDKVKKGSIIAVLEAMKLENEILCPVDGVVKQVLVSKGTTVNNQQVLFVIG